MRTTYNDCKLLAEIINDLGILCYHIKVSKRNGYYAIDGYHIKDTTKKNYVLQTGMTVRECFYLLKGMRVGYFYTKV